MNRMEFQSAMNPMCKALKVKLDKFQADLYFEEFKTKDSRDFHHACHELSFPKNGKAGYLPPITFFRDNITSATEMRHESEKLKREQDLSKTHQNTLTPQERLEANRSAFEALRQSKACRATGSNCWDPAKVRAASHDSSKDEEIREKYGDEGISPAKVFGTSFLLTRPE